MSKKIFLSFLLGIFIVLLGVQTVSAAPPTFSAPTTSLGIAIEHPLSSSFEVNKTHKFHFHIFNVTDGKQIQASAATTCSFHLYDPAGNHILKMNYNVGSDDVLDYEALVTGGNFSYAGNYAFVFQCNQSTIGGFYAHDFEVTPKGIVPTISRTQTATRSIYFLFAISILLFIAFLFVKSKPPVKWTYFLISMMFFLQSISILYTALVDEVVNPKIEGYFSFLASASFILFWFAFGILAVLWFLTTLQTLLLKQRQKKQESYQ